MIARTLTLHDYDKKQQEEADRARAALLLDREYGMAVEGGRVYAGISNHQLAIVTERPQVIVENGLMNVRHCR